MKAGDSDADRRGGRTAAERAARPRARAGWAHFEHMADIGLHGYGPDPETAFEQAALALTAVVADPGTVCASEPVEIRCQAPDRELLLVDWLNAIIYEMATRRMLFGEFRAHVAGGILRGEAIGEKVNVAKHQPATEVKGATLSELSVQQESDGLWHARCIVDV